MKIVKGIKKTKCCNSYTTYHDEILCCKNCWGEVEVGEGDGSEFVYKLEWEVVNNENS